LVKNFVLLPLDLSRRLRRRQARTKWRPWWPRGRPR
jgi:hypothetical protein